MPKEAEIDSPELENEVGLNPSLSRPERPIVDAKVVYLGSHPYMALSLKGRLILEPSSDAARPPVRKATRSGREHYDFASLGSDGRPIEERRMPLTHPVQEVRGKPFSTCSHIDHLYEFSQMRDDNKQPMFKIVAAPREMAVIESHIQAELRRKQMRDRFTDRVAA